MNYKTPIIKIWEMECAQIMCSSSHHDNGNHNGFDHSGHYGYGKWVGEEEE